MSDFLGIIKSLNYEELVQTLLISSRALTCNMSVQVHFLHSHLDYFPGNLGEKSNEKDSIKIMESRHEGRGKKYDAWLVSEETVAVIYAKQQRVSLLLQ